METEQVMEKKQYVVWYKKYSVGNEILDAQHREMFNLINTLYTAISTGSEHINVMGTLKYLYKYANMHFLEEENAMAACEYPALLSHKMMHWIYIKKIDHFIEQFQQVNTDVQYSLLLFLRSWWRNHILRVDQEYTSYMRGPKGEEYARTQSARLRKEKEREKDKFSQEKKEDKRKVDEAPRIPVKNEKYYASILGLPGLITKDNLKKAYHQKVKEYHPDRVANLGIKLRLTAEEEMGKINEAFDFLRKKYGPS